MSTDPFYKSIGQAKDGITYINFISYIDLVSSCTPQEEGIIITPQIIQEISLG